VRQLRALCAFALLASIASTAVASDGPRLQIDAPPELLQVRHRLEAFGPSSLADVVQLVGVVTSEPPIHIVLTAESSELARRVQPWIAGFADGESNTIVIFPARSPSYPDDTLEDVLRHEVAHILIWRASAGHPVPRWFHEGVAMTAERARRFQDQTQLFYQLMTGSAAGLDELDRLFAGSQADQTRAYALAGAMAGDLFQRYGSNLAGNILWRVGHGESFDVAFAEVTDKTASAFEADFWRRQRIWTSWLPILSSPTVLWLGVTALALLAIYFRHRKNRKIEKQWEEEDADPGNEG
jgi:hypothetical protein